MTVPQPRVRPTAPAPTPRRGGAALALALILAVSLAVLTRPASVGAATATNTATFAGSVPISVVSITISPATATFASCSGGSPASLGFPNDHCESPAITVTGSGGNASLYGTASNASAADDGPGWSLCVPYHVAGTPECRNELHDSLKDGEAPGADQFALADGIVNGGNGFLQSTSTCVPGYSSASTSDCDGLSNTKPSDQLNLTLTGPERSSDDSSPFTFTVTLTVLPGGGH